MLNVRLGAAAGPGRSHEQRLASARQIIADLFLQHGPAILAVGIYGTTAIGLDGPFSDLDMTFITRTDISHESAVITRNGLLVNLDYQTWNESVAEANDPELAGTWADFLALHDPDGLFPALAAIAEALPDEEYAKAFARKLTDDVPAALGKIRNAVAAADRASFLSASQSFSEAICRAICLRNRRYITGQARLREMAKQLPLVPDGFGTLIDTISGAQPATDQDVYDAAETLWIRIRAFPR